MSAAASVRAIETATGVPATASKKPKQERRNDHGHVAASRRSTPAVFPPSQKLPVLRRQCAEDRLQGRQAAAAVRVRTGQDRPQPHYRGLGKKAAGTCASNQTRALSRAAPVCHPLIGESEQWTSSCSNGYPDWVRWATWCASRTALRAISCCRAARRCAPPRKIAPASKP